MFHADLVKMPYVVYTLNAYWKYTRTYYYRSNKSSCVQNNVYSENNLIINILRIYVI